jgi:hypothetical protein
VGATSIVCGCCCGVRLVRPPDEPLSREEPDVLASPPSPESFMLDMLRWLLADAAVFVGDGFEVEP